MRARFPASRTRKWRDFDTSPCGPCLREARRTEEVARPVLLRVLESQSRFVFPCRGEERVDPLPRYQNFAVIARLWPSGFRHRSSKAVHAGSSPARRSMPRSFNGRTKVFGAFYVGSIPALGARLCWRGVRCTGGLINRFAPDQSMDWVRLPAPAPCVRSS